MINIGTSGWHYTHWYSVFYPEDVRRIEMLRFYSQYFKTVEINGTFYRLPTRAQVQEWYDSVPNDFIFAVKASRFITHAKKLIDPEEGINRLFHVITALEDKLGPILFQLPPRWKLNFDRLKTFLSLLPRDYRYAFEFRHPSWLVPEVYDLLNEYQAALCIYELAGYVSLEKATADFMYIRLHGPSKAPYQGSYSEEALIQWAQKIKKWSRRYRVYCYFDNDDKGYAVLNAKQLLRGALSLAHPAKGFTPFGNPFSGD